MAELERLGVVGCGLMGSGIAEVMAVAGYDVRVREVDEEALETGRERILESMDRAVEREKLGGAERDAARDRISFTLDLEDLEDRDLVVEAVVEDREIKARLFSRLDEICPSHTILTSNTSSLNITDLAAATRRRERVLGLHFFNPVPVMKLVEVVRTIVTDDEVHGAVERLARSLGKDPVTAPDRSGFVVNLLLVPFMLDAIRHLERGVSTIEDMDKAMTLGTGHPMGPFTLCDFVGLDTLHRISEIMFQEYREARYAPPPLLSRLVSLGRHGRKSGMGFYDWRGEEPVALEP